MAALNAFPPQKAFGSITDGPAVIIRSYCHLMMCPVSRGDCLAQSEVLRTLYAPQLRTYSAGTFLGRLVRELRSQESIQNDAQLVKAVWTKAVQLIRKGCRITGRVEDLQSMGIFPSITPEEVSFAQLNAIGNRIVGKEEKILERLSDRFFEGHAIALGCQFSIEFLRDGLGGLPDRAERGAKVREWMAGQTHRSIDYKLTIEEGAKRYCIHLHGSSGVKSFCVGSALAYAVKDGYIQAVRLILENAVHIDPLLMAAALLVAVVQGYNPILALILKRPQQEFANCFVRDAWEFAQKNGNTDAQNLLAAHFSAKTFYAPMESLPLNALHYRK